MGAWVGGEFIGGSADFFQSLYEVIMTFADRYFERIDKVFHQGDEMLTSIAIEEMRLSNKFILIDGGSVGTIYRYYSFYEKRPIDYYKSWFYHLLCDKSFLATIRASQINSNEDFCRLYRRYWGSILMRMKRLYKRIKSLIP